MKRGKMNLLIASVILIIVVAGSSVVLLTQPNSGEEYAVIETKYGKMVVKFFSDDAPGHVQNFKNLTKQGFYNETTFHRVIPGFMIQGGDPNSKDDDRANDGIGGPGYSIPAEFNDNSHKRGIVSMARSQDPNSAGSQFFIVVKSYPSLDHQYTVFGEVIEGMDVADKIVAEPRDALDNPLTKVEMKIIITTTP